MLTRKCDICGAEMRMTTPRYKVTFDGWLYKSEKDICVPCFERIKAEIQTADTPQTDCDKCIWNVCNYNKVDWDADTPQTDCETCRHYKLACELFSEVCKYEPTTQTETQNSNLTFETPQTEEKHAICNGCVYCDLPNAFHPCASCVDFSKYVGEESGDTPQTDCGWGEPR